MRIRKTFQKQFLFISVLVILVARVGFADDSDHGAQSFLNGSDPNQRLRVSHVHGAGFEGPDLVVATHLGLIRYRNGQWIPEDSPPHDFMGFSVVENGVFISGHPSFLHIEELGNPLGIIFSTDWGKTLQRRGYSGEIDFHWLDAGYSTSSVFALTSQDPTTGSPLFVVSDDSGATWQYRNIEGTRGTLIDIVAHPTKGDIVYVLTSEGIYVSEGNSGRFLKLASVANMKTMTISRDGTSIYVGGSSLLALDMQGRLKRVLRIPEIESMDVIREIATGSVDSGLLAYITGFRHVYLSNNGGGNWQKILSAGDATG